MEGWSSENTNAVVTEQHRKEFIQRLEDQGCLQPEQTDTLGPHLEPPRTILSRAFLSGRTFAAGPSGTSRSSTLSRLIRIA